MGAKYYSCLKEDLQLTSGMMSTYTWKRDIYTSKILATIGQAWQCLFPIGQKHWNLECATSFALLGMSLWMFSLVINVCMC